MPSELESPEPRTIWEKLYVGWFILCFLMVWVGVWAVNEPVAVLGGFPLVYAWCSGWGIVWQAGCCLIGLKVERDDEAAGRA